jgi:3-phytase
MTSRRLLALVPITAMLAGGVAAFADEPEASGAAIPVTEDAHVKESQSESKLGIRDFLEVDADSVAISFLKFDVGGSELELADVTLHVYAHETHTGFEARAVDSDSWSEKNVTWKNAPEPNGEATAGSGPVEAGWVSLDVSSLVNEPGIHSIALVTSSSEGLALSSREGKFPPELRVAGGSAVPAPSASESPGIDPAPEPSDEPSEEPTPLPEPAPSTDPSPESDPSSGTVTWTTETPAVRGSGDVADDPAIWVDRNDPSSSVVIGSNKHTSTGGLHVYDLDGGERQYVGSGRMNNVDVRRGVELGGQTMDLVAATNRTKNTIDFFRMTPNRTLAPAGSVKTGIAVYGSCMYRSPAGDVYAFATSERGEVEQYRLEASRGSVTGTRARTFNVGSDSEGCVADDELGSLYVNEEKGNVWKYGAAPSAGSERTEVDSAGSGRLRADVEGATIYDAGTGTGYLIVSSQGSSSFAVYDRAADNAYIGSFEVAGDGDGVSETDGIDVTSTPLGSEYPQGLLVVHDSSNSGASASNYKFVGWHEIVAALALSGDPGGVADPVPDPVTSPAMPVDEVDGTLPEVDETEVSTNVLRAPGG